MDKWTGGQNGGNHCRRIAYRKKNEKKKNEDSLRDLWDNIKCINICIIGVPEREDKGPEKKFEEMIAENSLTLERK